MIQFKDIDIRTDFGFEFINISFELEDTTEDLSKYRFDLYRAYAVTDEYKLVYSNIQNFECNDYSINLLNDEVLFYYKVKATNILTDDFVFSDVVPATMRKGDNYQYYITEIYNKYLNDVVDNDEVILLKRMRTGELCDCYDDIRGSRKGDQCTSCFGTGYKGGFYPPSTIKVCYFNVESITEEMGIRGTFKSESPVQFWTANYPVIQEGDIVVNTLTADKYTVTNWQPSYKNGFLIRQTVQVTRIPEASIYQKIKI